MRVISAPSLETDDAGYTDRAILCLELNPHEHLLLWSFRELLTARLEGRSVRHLNGLKGMPDRASTILLRLLASELAATTCRNLHFGQTHCQHLLPDELVLLAAIDRLQASDDARAVMLLENLCASHDIHGLLEAADHLCRALHKRDMVVQVMHLVPPALLPSIH